MKNIAIMGDPSELEAIRKKYSYIFMCVYIRKRLPTFSCVCIYVYIFTFLHFSHYACPGELVAVKEK